MNERLVLRVSSEEEEFQRKSAELAASEADLLQGELDLATLHAELKNFEREYQQVIGTRYAEFERIEQQIAEYMAYLELGNDFKPSEDLKKLYREKDIYLYINSPGGSVSAGMVIFDTMNQIRPDVCTVCIGFAGRMSGFLLSAGAKGKRMSLPASRMMLCPLFWDIHHRGTDIKIQDTAKDIEIQARETLYHRHRLNNLLAQHTEQPVEKIESIDRDFYMSPIEARNYSLIDMIVDRPVSDSNPPTFA
jgi:ATP-dependent Clp protease, protease subunit